MQDTPKDLDKKRADEKLLVSEMIALYCRRQHLTGSERMIFVLYFLFNSSR